MTSDNNLPRLNVTTKTGDEPLHDNGRPLEPRLLNFWKWAVSDLVSNATRGLFAEFLVATALDIPIDIRDEWAAYDLDTPEGIRVEVKSSAYIQTWAQKELSTISYSIKPSIAWSADTGSFEGQKARQSDVYVFALLHERDQKRIDPLDISQWTFFVLSTRVLNEKRPKGEHISLNPLRSELGAKECSYSELRDAVQHAHRDAPGC